MFYHLLKKDVISGLFCIFLSIFVYYQTCLFKIPYEVRQISPFLFPRLVALALFISGLIILIKGIFNNKGEVIIFDKNLFYTRSILILVMLVYLFLVEYIGFVVSTAAFLITLMLFLEREKTFRKMAYSVVISIITSIAIKFLFYDIMHVILLGI